MVLALKSGDRIGQFRLLHAVGAGATGSVWAAQDDVNGGRQVALKILHPSWVSRPEARERLEREARASRRVRHPGVVPVEELLSVDNQLVLVMELLAGTTLRTLIDREESVVVGRVVALGRDVALVLAAAHAEGIAHRDLKPENVFLTNPATISGVRLLDFGLAKWLPNAALEQPEVVTALGSVLGTPAYMAPEQALGAAAVNQGVDIWALGVMLYELLAGCRPIEGATPDEMIRRLLTDAIAPLDVLAANVPDRLTRLVGAMLEREASRRPNAIEVAHELSEMA